ncbi:ComEC/Rec2 family competence protein [Actinomadura flavalba]|uniref:ComEC/Rec2 family competence protein n=1 Tax=Actinomadura flavalba TaxID=1120938 RepID=UPI000369380D|nr:hypothetical protein [Actinomadura flavalba]
MVKKEKVEKEPRDRLKGPTGITKRSTRSQTKPGRDAALAARLLADEEAAQALADARAEQLRNIPRPPDGNRGDEHFHAAFIRMGMGDCAIFSTPGRRIVMIDCGTDSYGEVIGRAPDAPSTAADQLAFTARVRDTIYNDSKFMLGTDVVDLLILTHPDGDHYNQLAQILKPTTQIHRVYHSRARREYAIGQTSSWLLGHVVGGTEEVRSRRISQVENHRNGGVQVFRLNDQDVTATTGGEADAFLDGAGGIRVLTEPDCKITLLAGGVETSTLPDSSTPNNRSSIVVLIEVHGKRLLLSGDATLNTERYVVDRHAGRIGGVDLASASHHGSVNTSSLDAYVTAVHPKQLVISAGKEITMHHLPSQAVIDRYLAAMPAAVDIPDHTLYYWAPGGMGSYLASYRVTRKPIYITGSRGTVQRTFFKNGTEG